MESIETRRHLVIVLGDQLDLHGSAFDGFDTARDAVWMAEVAEESTHVWSSKSRTVLFLTAMRHFAGALASEGRALYYTKLDDPGNRGSLAGELDAAIERIRPQALLMTAPGDWRVLQAVQGVAVARGVPLHIHEDRHFFCTVREFAAHAKGRKQLRMEYFYREMRKRHAVLMDRGKYIERMSPGSLCGKCCFRPSEPASGPAPLRHCTGTS
jgi:deoxyribodipyrimidine photolyase-related protein